MKAEVTCKGQMGFEGRADTGHKLPLGADSSVGEDDECFRPIELSPTKYRLAQVMVNESCKD